MTGGRRHRLAAVAAAGTLALGAAGCGQLEHRTGPKTMDLAMSKSFKRSAAAAYRMTTGHPNRSIVRHARTNCRPRGPEPQGDARWRWFCKVLWFQKDRPEGHLATYGLSVDSRGCFEARSADFPLRLRERVLDRPAENPLVYIRSCP
jgi:hypothetical protein